MHTWCLLFASTSWVFHLTIGLPGHFRDQKQGIKYEWPYSISMTYVRWVHESTQYTSFPVTGTLWSHTAGINLYWEFVYL